MRTKSDIRLAGPLVGEGAATCDLVAALEADDRFRRDSVFGGIFHLGAISFRDLSATNSLHVVIRGDRVSAHVDEVSPLVMSPDGSRRYAWGRVVAHNLLVLLGDASRRLGGQRGRQRCNLQCVAEWVDDDDEEEKEEPAPDAA